MPSRGAEVTNPIPLDLAEIMAEHRPLADGRGGQYCAACHWITSNLSVPHPCLPYRLAEALDGAERALIAEQLKVVNALVWLEDPPFYGGLCAGVDGAITALYGTDESPEEQK